jgi:hypothetical protein
LFRLRDQRVENGKSLEIQGNHTALGWASNLAGRRAINPQKPVGFPYYTQSTIIVKYQKDAKRPGTHLNLESASRHAVGSP